MARATSHFQTSHQLPALITFGAVSVLLLLVHVDSAVLGAQLEAASKGSSALPSLANSSGLTSDHTARNASNPSHTSEDATFDQLYSVSVEGTVHVQKHEANDLVLNWSRHDRILLFTVPFEVSIVIRCFVFLYSCLVIGYLCDEYFVPSLENIGEELNFSSDLIGAILIPFGTSGPEIFSSAVGVFFAQNDIGTGAIIGSAVFNMLAIPAACGLAAAYFLGDSIQLQESAILRDLLFYIVSIMVLILVVKDNTVDLLDSSLLILLFVIYVSVMLYNAKFKSTPANPDQHVHHQSAVAKSQNNNLLPYQSYVGPIVTINNHTHDNRTKSTQQSKEKSLQTVNPNKSKMKQYLNKCNEIMTGEKESIMDKVAKLYSHEDEKVPLNDHYFKDAKCSTRIEAKLHAFIEDIIVKENGEKDRGAKCKTHYEKLSEEEDNGFGFTNNCFLRWILMPFSLIFYLTMPTSFSSITFFFSITWLSVLSYLTVWSISGLSDFLGIPPTVSGMTILAAGSAVPDLVTSIIVIKKTRAASMGICAAIASNIFAILLGLGLPWLIRILLNWCQSGVYASSAVVLESNALPFTSIILLGTVFVLYLVFRLCKWRISTRFSLICVVIHALFIASNIALELLIGGNS